MKQKKLGKGAVLAAMLLGVSAFAGSACYAAEGADLDLTQKGSITIYFSSEENKVTDGVITVYQVAALYFDDGDMAYELTDGFAEFEGELDVTAATLSTELAEYVEAHTAEGTGQAIGEDGSVVFTDLEPGLYLVIQTVQSSSYYRIDPFVVTVPLDVNGEWVYYVDASPKTEIEPESEIESESGDETEAESETQSETAAQTETETSGQAAGSESETETNKLPQTGQLNWPIPFLAAGGAVLLAAGILLSRPKNKEGE